MFNCKTSKLFIVLAAAFSAAMSSSAFAQDFPPRELPGPLVQAFCPNPAGKLQCVTGCMLDYINCKTRFVGQPPADVQACQAAYNSCSQSCNSRLIWTIPCDNEGSGRRSPGLMPEPLPW